MPKLNIDRLPGAELCSVDARNKGYHAHFVTYVNHAKRVKVKKSCPSAAQLRQLWEKTSHSIR